MWNESDIIAKSWFVTEVVNQALLGEFSVGKIFLVGSYASGKQTEWSDLDFVIELKDVKRVGFIYPSWTKQIEIREQLGYRVHVVFGTEEAVKRLHEKNKNNKKDYSYKELTLPQGESHVSRSS